MLFASSIGKVEISWMKATNAVYLLQSIPAKRYETQAEVDCLKQTFKVEVSKTS